MSNVQIKRLIAYFIVFVFLQIPMLHSWVLFDVAFPFQYIGLIVLLPHQVPKGWVLTIAFFLGLLLDVFSNTPGLHASASVFIAYLRLPWLNVITDATDVELDISIPYLGLGQFLFYIVPLILVHHFMLFTLENEGFKLMGLLISKVLASVLFSCVIIGVVAFLLSPKKRRV